MKGWAVSFRTWLSEVPDPDDLDLDSVATPIAPAPVAAADPAGAQTQEDLDLAAWERGGVPVAGK